MFSYLIFIISVTVEGVTVGGLLYSLSALLTSAWKPSIERPWPCLDFVSLFDSAVFSPWIGFRIPSDDSVCPWSNLFSAYGPFCGFALVCSVLPGFTSLIHPQKIRSLTNQLFTWLRLSFLVLHLNADRPETWPLCRADCRTHMSVYLPQSRFHSHCL